MPHYTVDTYAQSTAYIDGVRASPTDSQALQSALAILCAGLTELAGDEDFWDELSALFQEEATWHDIDALLDLEHEALEHDGTDPDTARRLIRELDVSLHGRWLEHQPVDDLRPFTEWVRDQTCTQADDLERALQQVAQGPVPRRGLFRTFRIALGGVQFIAGAAVAATDIYVVLQAPPTAAAALSSATAGVNAMKSAYERLRADLEIRDAAT